MSRSFQNLANETARLLVMIQIPTEEQADRVAYASQVGAEIEREFGKQTIEALNAIDFKFDAGRETA